MSNLHTIICGRNVAGKTSHPVSVDTTGALNLGSTAQSSLTDIRTFINSMLTYTVLIYNNLNAGVVDVHTFHTAETIVGAGTLSSGVFTNTRVVGKDKLGLCVSASLNHFTVVVYVSNDNTNWIALSTHPAESNGVHQALTNAFKYYKLIITNNDPTTSVVITVADLSH
jgi:hypothetical protein